jgi:hypothetical protein
MRDDITLDNVALSGVSVVMGTPAISRCVNVSSIALAAGAVCMDYDSSVDINGNILEDEVTRCVFLGCLVRYVGQVDWPERVEWIT